MPAEFFLVRDGEVISTGATTIRVAKTGIERWLYNLSRQQPLAYGLMSVALALLAGWLAAAAFAFVRRHQPSLLVGSSASGGASRARSAIPSGAFGRASA